MLLHMSLHYLVHHLLVGPVLLVSSHQLDPAPSPDCLHQLLLLSRRVGRAGRSFRVGMREQGLDLLDGVRVDLAVVLQLALHGLLL